MKVHTIPQPLAGAPAACSADGTRMDVFAVAAGGAVWRNSWDGTSWVASPLALPPNVRIPPFGMCAVRSGPGQVEVFAADSATRSPVWWRGNGSTWTSRVLPPGSNMPERVRVAAACASPNDMDVVAVGAGNTPWWWHWNGTWTPPVPLPQGAGVPAVPVAAVSPAPGRLDVFATGAGNHLWHWWTTAPWPGVWSREDLGGNIPAVGVSAVSCARNRIDVFAASREPGNPLLAWRWNGGAWVGPRSLGGSLTESAVCAVSGFPDELDVVAVGRNQRLSRWQFYGGRWSGPLDVGESVPAGDLSAVARGRQRLDVFAAGGGNIIRQWPGGGVDDATTQPWVNLASNRQVASAGQVAPDSLEELVTIVQQAERLGRGVRAVGSSWSNSDVAVAGTTPPTYVVDTSKLNRVLTHVLDRALTPAAAGRNLVHVEAGMKVHELNTYLDARNLALTTMGGASGQSLAGVLATGVHGMDIDRGPIPDMVRAIHLVGPGGTHHWIEPSEGITRIGALDAALRLQGLTIHYDDDWFNAALVSVGSLGVVYSAVVEVVPQYDIVATNSSLDWDVMKVRLRANGGPGDPFTGSRGVGVVLNPYPRGDGSRVSYLTTRTEATATGPSRDIDIGWLAAVITPALFLGFSVDKEQLDDVINDLTGQEQGSGTARGWSHTMMGGPNPPSVKGLALEIAFDATNTRYLDFIDAALEILRKAYYDDRPRVGYLGWISVRFQGRSRAYLAPQHQSSRTCTVEFAAGWRDGLGQTFPDTATLMSRLEAEGRKFGGIQHWGMFNDLRASDVALAYPELNRWRRVRWALTRGGTLRTFDSDFTRRCGLSRAPQIDVGDFDGDGRADMTVWRPADSTWYIIDSSTGNVRTQQLGQAGDIPVPGDYSGDGRTDIAVWRPSNGTWYIIDSSTGSTRTQQWGQAGDIPVPGDYDGDGRTDIAVWRANEHRWYIIDSSTGVGRSQDWGDPGDIPVPGDYDGDGRTDIAVWRANEHRWYIIDSSTGVGRSQDWGDPGDIPVPGDYDGDGTTDIAVWRPSGGNWYIVESSTGSSRTQQWGQPGDVPVPGDYNGDGRTDIAVWRPSDGVWYIIDSARGGPVSTRTQQWGQAGDVPIAAWPVAPTPLPPKPPVSINRPPVDGPVIGPGRDWPGPRR